MNHAAEYADHCQHCPKIFKLLNSCPNMSLLVHGTIEEITIETILSVASALAYFVFFFSVLYGFKRRTARGFCIGALLAVQVLACEIFKAIYSQARPKGACASSSGYPSSHASFISTMYTWLVLEWIFLDKNAPFKLWKYYAFWRNIFFVYAPLVPISRSYLNYHTLEQIIVGLGSGVAFAIIFFIYVHFSVVKAKNPAQSPLGRFWKSIDFFDNLAFRKNDPELVAQIQELEQKYNFIHSVKTDLLQQKELLSQRLAKMENKKAN